MIQRKNDYSRRISLNSDVPFFKVLSFEMNLYIKKSQLRCWGLINNYTDSWI